MASFGQGFAQAFLGMQEMQNRKEALKQQAEQQKLDAQLMAAKVKHFEAEQAVLQREYESGELLKKTLLQGQPTTMYPGAPQGTQDEGAAFAERAPTPGMGPASQQNQLMAAMVGMRGMAPYIAKAALEQGQPQGVANPMVQELMQEALNEMRGGRSQQPEGLTEGPSVPMPGAPPGLAMEGTPAPMPSPPPGLAMPGTPAPMPGAPPMGGAPGAGRIRFEGMKVNPTTGSVTLDFGRTKFEAKSREQYVGPGVVQQVLDIIDPTRGTVVATQPVGQAAPVAEWQKAAGIAQTWGVDPKSTAGALAAGEILEINNLPQQYQLPAMLRAKAHYARLAGSGASGPASGAVGPGLVGEAQQIEAQGAELTRRGIERAQREEQPVPGEQKVRLEAMQAAERAGQAVMTNFRPEFVGKGFGLFKKKLDEQVEQASQQKYVPGALAGNLREFFGTASGQEIEFRKSLADAADILLRARSGAAINEPEFRRMVKLLGQLTDEPQVFKTAMGRFNKEVGNQINDILKVSSSGAKQLRDERAKGTKRFRLEGGELVPVE